ncbi:acyl-CoA dehydrogenase [Acetobacter tropicalis]|nr:acyl-CoA dehydrogenase [Acetobacter tropicalis]KAA8389963.1 acyl-CoA dehydrogenase [Acetobacter tropicalis]KAA8393016.1 acyl-CoA dehydrogenase [Acetobacter tropicalis]MBC9008067.1 acyl-CoA dehydrogenase [Acetobacter tropicalis]MDO8172680.1 acyl-CoA dehydrogenase [Acetobacter tropicalis]
MSVCHPAEKIPKTIVFRSALKRLYGDGFETHAPTQEDAFPSVLLENLTHLGVLSAVLPVKNGGLGLYESLEGMQGLIDLLRVTGRLSLSLGRCIEGHINVVRLVSLYGSDRQQKDLAALVKRGVLGGIWVTDGAQPVTLEPTATGYCLNGVKGFCSAVRQVGVALITARTAQDQDVMVLVPTTEPERIGKGPGRLTGMAASGTGAYDFTGVEISADSIIGQAGDYLRQPEFSAGAWRGSAVALGGMDALVDLMRQELRARGRAENPHQQRRIGEALILRETASLWVHRAAKAVYGVHVAPEECAAIVNLARIAVEQAGVQLLTLVQQALGLSAFIRGKQVEQTLRDLATYLRQPAPDETLTEAAAWFVERDWPEETL